VEYFSLMNELPGTTLPRIGAVVSRCSNRRRASVVSTNWMDNLYLMGGAYIGVLRCMRPLSVAHMVKGDHVCATQVICIPISWTLR
jgi:hypothetical protein